MDSASQPFPGSRVVGVDDDDQHLVARCLKGDRDAFAELVVRYQRPIHHLAYRVLGNVEDAREITQGVFLRIAEHLHEYDSRYKFFSWIYRSTINASLNLLRRNGREERYANLGAQVDLKLSMLHSWDLTLSVGYAVGYREGQRAGSEWMISLKLL